MKLQSIRNERGVAPLPELVLIALVLALVGVALYQSNHQAPKDLGANIKPAVVTVGNVAEVTARDLEKATDEDTTLGIATEEAASQFTAVDEDVTDLGDSFNENNF